MKPKPFLSLPGSFFFLLFIFNCSFTLIAQQKIPKNYIGVTGNIEMDRGAISNGFEYERWLYAKAQFAIGAKAHYILPSKAVPNIFDSGGDVFERNRHTQVMATGYFFTGSEKEINGFFFSFAAGIDHIKWELEAYDNSGNRYIRKVAETSPGFDIAIGGQFKSKHLAPRITGGYQAFRGDKYDLNTANNGVSIFYIKVSLGF